jgi:hypothetical protein
LRADVYLKKHQHEKGFSVREVENALRHIVLSRGPEAYISWDDIIDIFMHRGGENNNINST